MSIICIALLIATTVGFSLFGVMMKSKMEVRKELDSIKARVSQHHVIYEELDQSGTQATIGTVKNISYVPVSHFTAL